MNSLWGQLAAVIVDKIYDPFLVLDAALRVKAANQSFYLTFDTTADQVENRLLYEISAQWQIPGLRQLLNHALSDKRRPLRVQIDHTFAGIGQKHLVFNGHTLELGETLSMETVIFLAIEDVAAYGQAEAAIQEAFNHLEQQIQQRTADLTQTIARLEQEIIERKRIEQALRASEARLAGIIDIAVDAIISVNTDQRIILFNQGAQAIFGYRADEVIGKPLSMLMPPRYEQLHSRHVERFGEAPDQARHMRERSAIWGLRKNGTEFPAEASISKLHFQGEVLFTVILRDITERRRLEENLRLALAKEKELNELRSRFISMVSHELRTPLAVILSANQALETFHQQIPETQRHMYHEHITQQVKHLTELLEDTLVISRVETLGFDFHPTAGDLNAFCQKLIAHIHLTTNSHHIVFVSAGALPAVFDEKLMWTILNNLLSNAIKYSPKGGTIELRLRQDGDQAVFQIQDFGIGIPEADQKYLFSTYYRGTNVGAIPGTGLGLAIVRQAVKAHGGSISFASREGEGTLFTVILPIHNA